jgi:protein-disulfide isomerase
MSSLKIPVTESDHIQGNLNAPLTLVEYGDYECPYCGEAYPMIKQVQEKFGKDLRFVFRNFPLQEMHPQAEIAAESAEFAGSHGLFWEMHDALYENQKLLSPELIIELAETLGLSSVNLQKALTQRVYEPKVRADFLGGVRSGVNGTPTFFINGDRHVGLLDYPSLVFALQQAL